uniref:Uncharacterized protein n=1 Tax=Schistocephalus solidus TaxID=70667 RepID=A0A0V0JBQ3_SCHSO
MIISLSTTHFFYYPFTITEGCPGSHFPTYTYNNSGNISSHAMTCNYLERIILNFPIVGDHIHCETSIGNRIACNRISGFIYGLHCYRMQSINLSRVEVTLFADNPRCVAKLYIEIPEFVYEPRQLYLEPVQEEYSAKRDAVSVYYANVFSRIDPYVETRIEDAWGNVIVHLDQNWVNLEDAFCRKNVTVFLKHKNANKGSKLVIRLNPMKNFSCSERDVIVTSVTEAKNLRLCRPVNAADRAKLKSQKSYEHLLRDSQCTITGQARQISAAVGDFSGGRQRTKEYEVQCKLFDYVWRFRVLKNLNPIVEFPEAKRKRCSPRARPARDLPFSTFALILGSTLAGIFLFFMVIIFVKYARSGRGKTRKSFISENELKSRIDRASHNNFADDPRVLRTYTAFLEDYSEEKHERLKQFVSAYLEEEKSLLRNARRQLRQRQRRLEAARSSTVINYQMDS